MNKKLIISLATMVAASVISKIILDAIQEAKAKAKGIEK